MQYNPPIIKHIDQVLPAIAGRPEFDVKYREDYIAIDYVFEQEDTFDDDIRLECRGLKFYPDGTIMARPFGKFFNVNQKEHTRLENLDFNIPHTVMEKLDGSMIHPGFIWKGHIEAGRKIKQLRFMTRAGITDVSQHAEKYLTGPIMGFCVQCETFGITPIFEFVSPQNRIVIKYEESELVYLGAREKETGRYIPREEIMPWLRQFKIPHVKRYSLHIAQDPKNFMEHVRDLQNQEGYVIQFESGNMVKVKAEDYVLKHRTKSYLDHEKNVFEIVMQDKVDDLIALLEPEDQEKVKLYASLITDSMYRHAEHIAKVVQDNVYLTKKDFALGPVKEVPNKLHVVAFRAFADMDINVNSILERVKQVFMKFYSTQTTLDENRELFNAKWN